jgi:hypothetical protein
MRLFVIAILVLVVSCRKTVSREPETTAPGPFNATVRWSGSPAVDGIGWILHLEGANMEKPSNLADEFQIDVLKVFVTYEPTTEKYPCFCAGGFINMIRIISITKS